MKIAGARALWHLGPPGQVRYKVVRQGLQAGVESYSIKRLEPLCGYRRQVDLRVATENLIAFEAALEDGTAAGDAGRQRVVAGYNEDDCRATLALRDWLEDRRLDLAERTGGLLPRPVVPGNRRGRPRTKRSPGSGLRRNPWYCGSDAVTGPCSRTGESGRWPTWRSRW